MQKLSHIPKKVTCPRCGLKVYEDAPKCPDCGLIFSRLDIATNKDAKKLMKKGERDFILKSTRLPSDVSFIKLLLLSIFLGPLGAHCFYVGRYVRGSIILVDMIAIFLLVVFNTPLMAIDDGALLGTFSTICGIVMLMWPWDVVMIILKKFKVPIAIDITGSVDKIEDFENEIDLKNTEISLDQEKEADINQTQINVESNADSSILSLAGEEKELKDIQKNIESQEKTQQPANDKNSVSVIKQGKDILDDDKLYNPYAWKEEEKHNKTKSKKRSKK